MKNLNNIRTIGLTLVCSLASVTGWIALGKGLIFCALFALLIIVLSIAILCKYQNRTTIMISRMIEGIKHNDFSLNYSVRGKSAAEKQLALEINRVVADFRSQLAEKESRYHYYDTLLNTVDYSLIVTDLNGNIDWMNNAARRDLCGYSFHNISDLASLSAELPTLIFSMRPGDVHTLAIGSDTSVRHLAVSLTEYSSAQSTIRLVSFKNVDSILEKNEMDAWQKLIRVLTHEIMNSIAPIISLSETLSERAQTNKADEKNYSLMLQAMQTIHRRSKGLLTFVENYRRLSRLPLPQFAPIKAANLMNDILKLFPPDTSPCHYSISDTDTKLLLDRGQIEQVLINLIKNATEACKEEDNPRIDITAKADRENSTYNIEVTDNGCGILPDVLDKIFVPFFTTKPSGSGIGLSISKQIVTNHRGTLCAKSISGIGSTFSVRLPFN